MNRENKRKQYEKDTIRHMSAMTALPAKYAADWLCLPEREAATAITVQIV